MGDLGYGFDTWGGDLEGTETPASIDDVFTDIPAKNFLGQNYPNPFTGETHIPYELEEASHVKLSVYTMLGREVAILVNEHQDAGSYEIVWRPYNNQMKKIQGGIYLFRLETDNTSVLIRKTIIQ